MLHGTDADGSRPCTPAGGRRDARRLEIAGPYVAFLGGLEPRKNLERLVEAFGMLEQTDVSLVIVGGAVRWAPAYAARVDDGDRRAAARRPRARVIRVGYVDDEDRRALLSGAEILAYPSRAEGFGFPVLEGFAANVPVLTSNTSSLPEVAGDAAVLVDPDDPVGDRGGPARAARRRRTCATCCARRARHASRRSRGSARRARPRPCCAVRRSTAARLLAAGVRRRL